MKKAKFKKGQKVHMYGAGEAREKASYTFWVGATGKVIGFDPEWQSVIVAPDEFPKERHYMHENQLRKVRR